MTSLICGIHHVGVNVPDLEAGRKFYEDVFGFEVIGVDNVTWESDYPHEDGFFPDSRRHLADTLLDVPEAVARKIAETKMKDLNANSVEAAMKIILGSAKSCGIEVKG